MRKTLLIAVQHLRSALLHWSYLATVVMPGVMALFFGAYSAFVSWAADLEPVTESLPAPDTLIVNSVPFEHAIGYVDRAGIVSALPAEVPADKLVAFQDDTSARAALESGAISGFYLIPEDYVRTGTVTFYSPDLTLYSGTDGAIERLLVLNLALAEGEAVARRVAEPMLLSEVRLTPTSQTPVAPGAFTPAQVYLGLGIAGFFLIAIQSAGNYVLTYLSYERSRGILEILLTSASPAQLLAGKLAGALTVSLLQLAVWLVWARLFAGAFGPLVQAPPGALGLAAAVFVAGYLAYAGPYAVVGALVRTYQESAMINAVLSVMAMFPLAGLFSVLSDPRGPAAVALSLFPLSAPIILTLRILLGAAPAWQIAAGLGLMLAWTGLMVLLAARLFHLRLLFAGRSWLSLRRARRRPLQT